MRMVEIIKMISITDRKSKSFFLPRVFRLLNRLQNMTSRYFVDVFQSDINQSPSRQDLNSEGKENRPNIQKHFVHCYADVASHDRTINNTVTNLEKKKYKRTTYNLFQVLTVNYFIAFMRIYSENV